VAQKKLAEMRGDYALCGQEIIKERYKAKVEFSTARDGLASMIIKNLG
jgi:hypothetical protein